MPRKINISEFKKERVDYKTSPLSKEKLVLKWILEWLKDALLKGKVEYGDILPQKSELAKLLGVSTGTVQNALRRGEDEGYFESKQHVGTMIKDRTKKGVGIKKMFSKKDQVALELKKALSACKVGTILSSIRTLSKDFSSSPNTLRLALENLASDGILERNEAEKRWYLKKRVIGPKKLQEHETLSKRLEVEIKNFLKSKFNQGDKIPDNNSLAKYFGVSVRTVNSAMKTLQRDKVILSRRGKYGTTYLGGQKNAQEEKSILISNGQKHYLYKWEAALDELGKYILENFDTGDKIPPIREMAKILNIDSNTLHTAVSKLCSEGILHTRRGKYGGVYVVSLPEKDSDAYAWLALNPKYIENLPRN